MKIARRCAPAMIAAFVFFATAHAQSQHAPQPAPDWTGYYTEARGKNLAGLQQLSPDLNEVTTAHLQPWARAKMEATAGVADDTGAICQPDGIFRYPVNAQNPGGFLWLAAPDKIWIVSWQINTAGVRRIYLNRQHPKNLLPTWNGDSIGHWEGDALVVDTIGFNDKSWLHPGMQPHTEEAHLIERYRQVSSGGHSFLEMAATVEDREALTSAFAFTRYFGRTGDSMAENICNDDIGIWKEFKNKALKREMERAREVRQP
jgi:hypothetical protein